MLRSVLVRKDKLGMERLEWSRWFRFGEVWRVVEWEIVESARVSWGISGVEFLVFWRVRYIVAVL